MRVSKLTGLPTTAVPATAPTSGSSKCRTSRGMASGARIVSASIAIMTSASVCESAKFAAAAFPPFGVLNTLTRGSSAKESRTISALRSEEPSSTTMTSKLSRFGKRTERTVLQMTASSLNAGTITATDRGQLFSDARRFSSRLCRSIDTSTKTVRRMQSALAMIANSGKARSHKPTARMDIERKSSVA